MSKGAQLVKAEVAAPISPVHLRSGVLSAGGRVVFIWKDTVYSQRNSERDDKGDMGVATAGK